MGTVIKYSPQWPKFLTMLSPEKFLTKLYDTKLLTKSFFFKLASQLS